VHQEAVKTKRSSYKQLTRWNKANKSETENGGENEGELRAPAFSRISNAIRRNGTCETLRAKRYASMGSAHLNLSFVLQVRGADRTVWLKRSIGAPGIVGLRFLPSSEPFALFKIFFSPIRKASI
jgi:hypothetical protein